MTNNSLTKKRIGIFILFSFGLCWIFEIIRLNIDNEGLSNMLNYLSMFSPAIANILTRIITKEGMHESYLTPNFKGNLHKYALAVIIPLVYGLAEGLIIGFVLNRNIMFDRFSTEFPPDKLVLMIFQNIAFLVPISFYTCGEEFGWRAYLVPKLENIFGITGSLIIGGIIWGLWHAPAIYGGLNQFTDSFILNVIFMCVFCIFEGIILTWLTKRTGSVWPAAIMHCMNNNFNLSGLFIAESSADKVKQGGALVISAMLLPLIIIAVILFIDLIRRNKREVVSE